ncbi:pyridoxal phosphate phosphatase PHOSPHO2 [Fistulifera solaris]|uniref:Pyridoxal phosphate phosphatase PHOSPHO2 n=1 Tax=Fistulifera solaris TaxID=1519565 RepID=A0A1Z5JHW0_FISSO|nr:pyridoxal phosphate phosphatase PHOSPHO2 [Fistulifera solaris]|eukprot:GAX13590.1 pyridoxal phosphate phosphatase PHOSPHO2 [Fistulifera solaris]
MTKRIAVIFDYDFTLIDCNSDTYVFERLWPSRPAIVQELYAEQFQQWTRSMDQAFALYYQHHPKNASRQTILSTVAHVPVQEQMLEAIRYSHALADLFIVSDANTDFIHAFLEKEGIQHLFTHVISNTPTNTDGRFGVAPYFDFVTREPHGCSLQCPPNMCKGKIVQDELQILQTYERVIYLGDGLGDFCPCHRLRETDYALARADFPLAKHIQENPIVANVRLWKSGHDVYQLLATLLKENESKAS